MRTTNIHMQAASELEQIMKMLEATKDPEDITDFKSVINSINYLKSLETIKLTPLEVVKLDLFSNVSCYALIFRINKRSNMYLALAHQDDNVMEFFFVAKNAKNEYQITNVVDPQIFV